MIYEYNILKLKTTHALLCLPFIYALSVINNNVSKHYPRNKKFPLFFPAQTNCWFLTQVCITTDCSKLHDKCTPASDNWRGLKWNTTEPWCYQLHYERCRNQPHMSLQTILSHLAW